MTDVNEHPFFRPLWRRVLIVLVALGWAAVEFTAGQPLWGMLALGFAGWALWRYIYLYPSADRTGGSEPKD